MIKPYCTIPFVSVYIYPLSIQGRCHLAVEVKSAVSVVADVA